MASQISNMTMNLLGSPYQFPEAVDPRIREFSPTIGVHFAKNIMLEAPICTLIPGEPTFLPGSTKAVKKSTAAALIEGVDNSFMDILKTKLKSVKIDDNDLRLYDFKNSYTNFMTYVNVLCRAGATFLGLTDKVYVGNTEFSFERYDWRNYKFYSNQTHTIAERANKLSGVLNWGKSTQNSDGVIYSNDEGSSSTNMILESSGVNEGELADVLTNYNYIQFYIDPDISPSESLSNSTGQSQLATMMDGMGSQMKEIAFMANSGGIDTSTLNNLTSGAIDTINTGVSAIFGGNNVTGALSRVINLGSEVLKGHNLVIPEIYQSSDFSKSYSITVHLRSPYGTKLGYYLNIFVPMMHLLAFTMPRQESANTFSSPFLVKAYVNGLFSCNLGIADSISISRVNESRTTDGLPTEVDVTLNIKDLYSKLMMSPSTYPLGFLSNSSLIEYIATNCGMSLTEPNYSAKLANVINSVRNSIYDIPENILGIADDTLNNWINSILHQY